MGRRYIVPFDSVSMTQAQDLVQVKGAAGKILKIVRQWGKPADGNTLPAAQNLRFRGRFLPATVTDGSGGAAAVIGALDPGDAAASFTAKINNTTKATTSGTAVILETGGEHEWNGYERVWDKAAQPTIGPSESWVFELLNAPSGTVVMSGGVEVEEIGG